MIAGEDSHSTKGPDEYTGDEDTDLDLAAAFGPTRTQEPGKLAASESSDVTVDSAAQTPVAERAGGPATEEDPAAPAKDTERRYEQESEVARGGMGVIYKVRDHRLHRTVAMKVLLDELAGEQGSPGAASPEESPFMSRFLEEAQVTAQLDHPSIIPVHDLGLDSTGRTFFTMRLVKGRSLGDVFERARTLDGEWNLPRAVGVMVKVCQAVAYAHSKNVIHRDLKPANIMVGRFGEVYVMDWGLAKVMGKKDFHDIRLQPVSQITYTSIESKRKPPEPGAESPLVTMDGAVVGTPAYMPPEQARGQIEAVDHASDIYSLGAILYHLLTGQPPYVEPDARLSPRTILVRVLDGFLRPVHQLNADAPPELAAICEKAMAREKAQRYESSQELAEDLQAYLDGRIVRAFRTGALAEFRSWMRRNRGIAIWMLAAIGLAMAGLIAVIGVQQRANREILLRTDADVAVALLAAEKKLWPRRPERVPAMEEWLERAEDLVGRLGVHRQRLLDLRKVASNPSPTTVEQVWEFDNPRDRFRHAAMASLVQQVEALAEPDTGTLSRVRCRLELARSIRKRTIDDRSAEWAEAIAGIKKSPKYDRFEFELTPQVGLVPIGVDRTSGLWEFWHVESGAEPVRDPAGKLEMRKDTGVVLVLIPGGTFQMGSTRGDEDEVPVHEVTLAPFFLSKYEMTAAQLRTVSPDSGRSTVDGSGPVVNVSWEECRETLYSLGLELPTEAQWEYAARGGTKSRWWTGEKAAELAEAGNLADRSFGKKAEEEWDDDYERHAPVGALKPNPFGLHDVLGNVWEWCRDRYAPNGYSLTPSPGDGEHVPKEGAMDRVARGGSFGSPAVDLRCANRRYSPPRSESPFVGVRPALRISAHHGE